MGIKIFQVDSFTTRPFSGNPAAVCLLEGPAGEAWMRKVASEMNLSETAFLYAAGAGYVLRWFTPSIEVDLCGHATLACAHVLWEEGIAHREKAVEFSTASGPITALRKGDWIEMDFPAEPETKAESPAGLAQALGAAPVYVGKNRLDYIVELPCEEAVRALRPDLGILRRIKCRGFIITGLSSSGEYDFVSRFFAPAAGIDEDPVTGSAHCCLGPYWAGKLGKNGLTGFQASERGGVVRVEVRGSRAILKGQAVTVLRGELCARAADKKV